MPRELRSHACNHLNRSIRIQVLDPPGPGGACRQYRLVTGDPAFTIDLPFQNGDPAVKINGISNESLLAVLEDRMVGFQSGQFACANNERALDHIRAALRCLNSRTAERVDRGVEGKQII